MKTAAALFTAACLASLAACAGKKQKDEPAESDGPKSTAGQVLDAANRAADLANENVRRINEAAESGD